MRHLLFLWFWLGLASSALAVEIISGPVIRQEAGKVTLHWRTDVPCGSRLRYGLQPDKLEQNLTGPVTAEHSATLSDLPTAGTLFYEVGSARKKLASGQFSLGTTAGPGSATPAAPAPQPVAAPKPMMERIMEALRPAAEKPNPEARSASTPARAPPTRATWGRMDTLQDHFDRHGPDFRSKDPDDYAAQAWHFLQRARDGKLLMKWDDSDQSLRVYDPATRAFAAYNAQGRTKTYFRPNSPTYWQRQPGRSIQPSQLPFP